MSLHVYEFDYDFIIAESEDDATAIYMEHYRDACEEDELREQAESVNQKADDSTMKVWLDEDGRVGDGSRGDTLTELTCSEWATRFHRGYFCGTEF